MAEPNPVEILHNITSDLVITTDADDLIELVKLKKEISFSDAAKQLKVSLQTIEAWASFFEEEGLLGIRYKLTTPYLVEKPAEQQSAIFEQETKQDYSFSKHKLHEQKKFKLDQAKEEKQLDRFIPSKKFKQGEKLKPIEISLELTKELNELLERAYRDIEEGNFESAQNIYSLIQKNYEGLPTDYLKMKKEFEENMTKLNKDLVINLHKASEKQAKLLSKLITSELKRMNSAMQGKNIKKAESIFKEVEQLFSKFPEGYLLKKTELQNQILLSYKNLVKNKHIIISRYIETKSKEIEELVNQVRAGLQENDMEKAFDNYEKLQAIYNKIPKGFLQDKPQLEKKVVQLLMELMSNKHEFSAKKISDDTQQIKSMLYQAQQLLRNNMIHEANQKYQQLKKLYDGLPVGFLKTKLELEEQILRLHQEITKRLNQEEIQSLHQGTKKINDLLKKAKDHLSKSEIRIAEDLHREIERHYNSLPKGFIQHKTPLKVQILDLYREILLRSSEKNLKPIEPKVEVSEPLTPKIQFPVPASPIQKVSEIKEPLPELKKATPIRSQPLTPKTSTPAPVKKLLTKAESSIGKNRIDDAKNIYEKVLKHDPTQPIARSRVKFLDQIGELSKASNIFEKSIANVKEQKQDTILSAFPKLPDLPGVKQIEEPLKTKPLKEIKKPEQIQAPIKEIKTKSLDELYNDAKKYYEQKEYYHSIQLFREVKKKDQNFMDVQKLLNRSLREQSRQELKEMLQKVKGAHENPAETKKEFEQPLIKTVKHLEEQEQSLQQPAQSLDQRRTERIQLITKVKLEKAKELIGQKRISEARSTLDSLLRINPNDLEARFLLDQIETKKVDKTEKKLLTIA